MSKSKSEFSSLKIASVIKPKNRPILQFLEIGNNNYILLLPFEGDIDIYNKFFIYQFSISTLLFRLVSIQNCKNWY